MVCRRVAGWYRQHACSFCGVLIRQLTWSTLSCSGSGKGMALSLPHLLGFSVCVVALHVSCCSVPKSMHEGSSSSYMCDGTPALCEKQTVHDMQMQNDCLMR